MELQKSLKLWSLFVTMGAVALLIGLDNATGEADSQNVPIDVAKTFHVDAIQYLVGKHLSEQFPLEVRVVPKLGHPVVVIEVPPA